MTRVFASPAPSTSPRAQRVLLAHGARDPRGGLSQRRADHNSFSYHFVPAGSMMETGAHALGCTVFPGGTGQTEQQVRAMAELKPAGYIGTPSFLKIMVEGRRDGRGPAHRRKALVSGEAFPPRCATGLPSAALRATSAMPRPTWA